jgi:hypothetical protein
MNSSITPPPGPDHQCINANCGCNDLVSAGPCNLWCSEHGVELADLERGKASVESCSCGHAICAERMAARTGTVSATAERGVS